jgi:nicotinate-nucleotide--dimethylbenzimidazole phosphoribosyltransferase
MAAARLHLNALAKPPGSLGRLEELAVTLAGITGDPFAPVAPRAIIIAAADHGVARSQAVSAWPPEVTAQMVATFLRGGAAISTLAAAAEASVTVLDAGIATPLPDVDPAAGVSLIRRPVRPGTDDLAGGPAMSRAEAETAVQVGREVVDEVLRAGARVIGVGEMGIGNSTAAAAITAVLTGSPARAVTGRGTGVDDAGWERKVRAVERAAARHSASRPVDLDPVSVLASVGGLEIAALVGVVLGAAAARTPVILDGFITGAAALVAAGIEPAVATRVIAAHRSTEPGHAVVLDQLGLRPLLDLDLRLGEGTGAALAMLLIGAAARVRDGMATFSDAGVAGRSSG